MYDINISLDELAKVENKTRHFASQVHYESTRVKNVANDMGAAWQSDSSSAYVIEVEDAAKRMEALSKDMENLANAVRQFADKVKQAEKEISEKVNQGP